MRHCPGLGSSNSKEQTGLEGSPGFQGSSDRTGLTVCTNEAEADLRLSCSSRLCCSVTTPVAGPGGGAPGHDEGYNVLVAPSADLYPHCQES